MPIIAGYFNSKKHTRETACFPVFSDTVIRDHYEDAAVLFQSIQQTSIPWTSSALFYDASSQIVVLADAHLLDRSNLLVALNKPPSLNMLSDAELIFHAYQAWGEGCAKHLIGNFAFAVWDIGAQELTLARDISGQRSLFYYMDADQTLYFASLPRVLSELPGFQKKINTKRAADFLSLLPGDQQTTFFEGIYSLQAAHTLRLGREDLSPRIQQYWSADALIQNPILLRSPEAYYEAFNRLFSEVMSDYISPEGVTACQLSGGLDSSAVTCMAAHLLQSQKKTLSAFCHVPATEKKASPYPGWNRDDTAYMEAVKDQYPNVSLHYMTGESRYLFEGCQSIHPWLDLPPINPDNNLWLLECTEKAKALGATILLTGERGNSTLSWTGELHRRRFMSFKRIQRSLATLYSYLFKPSSRPWQTFSGMSDALAHQTNLFKEYQQRQTKKNKIAYMDFRAYHCHHMIDAFSTAAFANTLRFLYGVEWMDPTADKRILEFCLRTPVRIFANQAQSRLLVRKGLGALLPQCIRERTSRGMQSADWYTTIDRQYPALKNILISWENTDICDYIDIRQLLEELEQWDVQAIEASQGSRYRSYALRYQNKLLRSLETGLFIQQHFS